MRFRPLLLLAGLLTAAARPTFAQNAGVRISGVVRDTLGHRALDGAVVQLLSLDDPTRRPLSRVADNTGRFAFDSIAAGRYALAFSHPLLDSLHLEPIAKSLELTGAREAKVDLSTPTVDRLRMAICGIPSGGMVLGSVRDATRQLRAGALVEAAWAEFSVGQGGVGRQVRRVSATTGVDGQYALCGVPDEGSFLLRASQEEDSTDRLDVEAPPVGLTLRDLFVGSARAVAVAARDSTAISDGPTRVGDGAVRGTVLNAVSGRPLANAVVRLDGSASASTDERGEFRLSGLPTGSRTLLARAIGFFPVEQTVDVIDAGAPVTLRLSSFKAVLDTVRIRATRGSDRSRGEFERRRRSGFGTYLDDLELEKRGGAYLSSAIGATMGVETRTSGFNKQFLMRADFGGYCSPSVYVDGSYMFDISADELDAWLPTQRVRGVEIYRRASVTPPEFRRGFTNCGAIVVWTK